MLRLLPLLQDFHIIPVLLNRQAVANVFKACKVVSRNVVTNDEVSGAQFTCIACFTCFTCTKPASTQSPTSVYTRQGFRCSVFLLYLLHLYKPGVLCASWRAWQRRSLSTLFPKFRIRNRVTILNSVWFLAGLTLEGFVRFIEGVAAASGLPVLEKRMLKEQGRSLSLLDKFHYLTGVFHVFFILWGKK